MGKKEGRARTKGDGAKTKKSSKKEKLLFLFLSFTTPLSLPLSFFFLPRFASPRQDGLLLGAES